MNFLISFSLLSRVQTSESNKTAFEPKSSKVSLDILKHLITS